MNTIDRLKNALSCIRHIRQSQVQTPSILIIAEKGIDVALLSIEKGYPLELDVDELIEPYDSYSDLPDYLETISLEKEMFLDSEKLVQSDGFDFLGMTLSDLNGHRKMLRASLNFNSLSKMYNEVLCKVLCRPEVYAVQPVSGKRLSFFYGIDVSYDSAYFMAFVRPSAREELIDVLSSIACDEVRFDFLQNGPIKYDHVFRYESSSQE